jgi:hypothetical protein
MGPLRTGERGTGLLQCDTEVEVSVAVGYRIGFAGRCSLAYCLIVSSSW